MVDSGLTGLARPQRGHFDLGTGFHGDLWLDLDALFLRPRLLRPWIRSLAGRLSEHGVDAVCGPVEGGSFLAMAIADILGAAHRVDPVLAQAAGQRPDPGAEQARPQE